MADEMAVTGTMDIAIIGYAGRFPGADSVEQLWQNLLAGTESISVFSNDELRERGVPESLLVNPRYVRAGAVLEDADKFDAAFFGYSPREAEIMDPQQRIFLESAWQALESAGYSSDDVPIAVGVFAGATMNTYMIANLMANRDVLDVVGDLQTMIGNDKDYLATRVSYELNLRGPSYTVQTACSTSLVAVHAGRMSLLAGECDLAIAGGSSVRVPQGVGYLHHPGGTSSPDGHCRAFDARAEGSVVGSGVGVVVLRRLDDAIAARDTIHAVIKSSAINNDGRNKVGFTAPSSDGQARVVGEALELAGIDPESVRYVEPHGTGTALGDPIEIAGLTRAFRRFTNARTFCAIGSLKTNIGHLDAAAGIASLLKAVQVVRHGQIPPSLHFEVPNPKLALASSPFFVARERLSYPADSRWPRRAGVSSFGIGGTNAHIIVEEPPAQPAMAAAVRPTEILTLSGKTPRALEVLSDRWSRRLAELPNGSLPDAAFVSHVGRRHHPYRRALLARTPAEAAAALSARLGVVDGDATEGTPSVVFLLPGQGTALTGAAASMYDTVPRFRRDLDDAAVLVEEMTGHDIRRLLYPQMGEHAEAERRLESTALAQPTLVALEWATARLFMAYGVRPRALVGHSVGEISAAAIAGVLSIEHALSVAVGRGSLMQKLSAGAMVAVHASPAEALRFAHGEIALAALNSPDSQVLSGPVHAILELERDLEACGVEYHRLRTERAFHSAMIDPIVGPLLDVFASVTRSVPSIPIISNVTGDILTVEQACDPAYWARHAREPVRFADSISRLAAGEATVFLDIGPGTTLSSLAALTLSTLPEANRHRSLPNGRASRTNAIGGDELQETLSELYVRGVPIDWIAYHEGEQRGRIAMPTYPFARDSFWIEGASSTSAAPAPSVGREVLSIASWKRVRRWDRPTGSADGAILIFAGNDTFGDEVVQRMRDHERVIVRPGATFTMHNSREFTLAIGAPDQYVALFQALRSERVRPARIIHLLSLADDIEPFSAMQTLLCLARAVREQDVTCALRVTVVSDRAFAVTGTEGNSPERAATSTACRDIPWRLSNVCCRHIDVQRTGISERALEIVVDELLSDDDRPALALRGTELFAPTQEPLPAPTTEGARIVGDGRSLVIVGPVTPNAVSLVRELTGEEGMPIVWCAPLGAGSIQPTGVQLVKIPANDAVALRTALNDGATPVGGILIVPSPFGPDAVTGPCRAVPHNSEAYLRERAEPLETLVKALGSDIRPEFVIHFGALATGPAGAEAFLDRVADDIMHARMSAIGANSPGRWCSVEWEQGAMELRRSELRGLLSTIVTYGSGQRVLVRKADSSSMAAPSASRRATSSRHARPNLRSPFVQAATRPEQLVAEIWEDLLGMHGLGIDDDFFQLGGHSLLATQLVSRLRRKFEIDYPMEAFLKQPTIRQTAAFIAACGEWNTSSAPLPPVAATGVERSAQPRAPLRVPASNGLIRDIEFSVLFFSASAENDNCFRLVRDAVRFADARGFAAVWTPERHFHSFGAFYPTPAVLGAALATETTRIGIRAGSVIGPIHSAIRIAEEWAVVDQLSNGRAAIAIASGWRPDDFVLQPQAYSRRRSIVFEQIDQIRHLWGGGSVDMTGPDGNKVTVSLHPRPVQPTLPIWVTSSGSKDTWLHAARANANVLTALLGLSVEELGERISQYRRARAEAGHDPEAGRVTVMLHAYVGESEQQVLHDVRGPFAQYLRTHVELYENYVRTEHKDIDIDRITGPDREALIALAVNRYVGTSSLIGTPQRCRDRIDQLQRAGVNEIACLLDFGMPQDAVMKSLELIDSLRVRKATAS